MAAVHAGSARQRSVWHMASVLPAPYGEPVEYDGANDVVIGGGGIW